MPLLVIAEYFGGEWRFMYNDRSWQIVTNGTFLYNVSESERRNNCPRYRTIDDDMKDVDGVLKAVPVRSEDCVACRVCEVQCPNGAIEIIE